MSKGACFTYKAHFDCAQRACCLPASLLFASETIACRRACYPGIQELLRNSWGESYTVESPNLINRFRRRIPELCRRVLLYMMLCIQSSLRLRSASLLFAGETIACQRDYCLPASLLSRHSRIAPQFLGRKLCDDGPK